MVWNKIAINYKIIAIRCLFILFQSNFVNAVL